ncbi:MAG: translocation/assembly module TamB domain-containing protein [Prevotella sp.]|nr:translocation/assembly module TamB domain-containing protein [Bacteroides sp.]MCM1366862.1 translocation/assembly module TamB domain-containing protein [Prevotella sp.]MCM1437412.1 translocation/assembly module TamB domain-containing protein [Prevotella sp.]
MNRFQRILSWLPAWMFSVLSVIVMCWLTLSPNPLPDDTPSFPGGDILAHGLMFGGITVCFLLDRQRRREWRRVGVGYIVWSVFLSTLMGVLIEYAQLWMELGRTYEVKDMLSDFAGSGLCGFLWGLLQNKWTMRGLSGKSGKEESEKDGVDSGKDEKRPRFRHQIKCGWVRIPLKVLLGVIIMVIVIPILIYIPPIQTLLKDVACSVMRSKTGMNVEIDKFRLRFPLDVSLGGVTIVEASGDTMVRAGELIADVRLLPLLESDVDIKRLELRNGYYRMLSSDSSMLMKIRAGEMKLEPGSSFDLKNMNLGLERAKLKDGDISLYMDVWKKKPNPDTTSTQMLIRAKELDLENIGFGMSMLPTIDTLNLRAANLQLCDGVIDLTNSRISAKYVGGNDGKIKYIQPTAEYVKSHPVPVDTVSAPSAPMVISIGDVALTNFDVLYATKGVKPAVGFDPSYISVSGLNIGFKDFYNESSTLRLPIRMLSGRERSGLVITSGHGTIGVDSEGINISDFRLKTLESDISADADLPFAVMEMKPDVRMKVSANASLGQGDIRSFMPMAGDYLRLLPNSRPIKLRLDAAGSIRDLRVGVLELGIPSALQLYAKGWVKNPMEFKKMQGEVTLDGSLTNPEMVDKLAGLQGFSVPSLTIKGTAGVDHERYSADVDLRTSAGDLAGQGYFSLTSESYEARIEATGINVGQFMPDLGLGRVSARIEAEGAGFNPERRGMHTDARIIISEADWKGKVYKDITADARMHNGEFDVVLNSPNRDADLDLNARGSILGKRYDFDINADVRNLDLQELGMSETMNNGRALFTANGYFDMSNWEGDVTFDASQIDWNMPDMYVHLPHGVSGRFLSEDEYTSLYIDSDQTSVDFNSPSSLRGLIDKFTALGPEMEKQISERHLLVDKLQSSLPEFELSLEANGKGMMSQFLSPQGISVDTVSVKLSNKDAISGGINLLGLQTSGMCLDTISVNLNQRESLLDYKAHIGNQPGTMDEFARVDLMGYLGGNRGSLMVTQRNLKGEMGYRLGLTAAVGDSVATVHFIPLKATVAYMPWDINGDNFIDVNFGVKPIHISANLQARSNESSILLRTQPNERGDEELYLNLDNIRLQDFMQMNVLAPPIQATVSSDIHIFYDKQSTFYGHGTLGVKDFVYQRQRVGDFDFDFNAGLDLTGKTKAEASLLIDNAKALTAHCELVSGGANAGLETKDLGLSLTDFPLSVANPFLGRDVVQLDGRLNGELSMSGDFSNPKLNGDIRCDSVGVYISMIGSTLRFDNDPIEVKDNMVSLKDYAIYGQNSNPLVLNGGVDASDLRNIKIDIGIKGDNFQLMGNDKRSRSDLYGKLFMNLNANATGPMNRMNVNAGLTILGSSDVTYKVSEVESAITKEDSSDVVRFVQFNDTTAVEKADSVVSPMSMRILADLNINPGTQVTVLLTGKGTDKVELNPSGSLSYFQNYMGDMRLNGQLNLGTGVAQYTLPIVGQKKFEIDGDSYVAWNGALMNPILNIHAVDKVKANVQTGGNAQLVNFNVSLSVTNSLSSPKIMFDLTTDDDLTIQNELQSMSADQRSNQAMNLLIYGQYTSQSSKTMGSQNIGSSMLYGMLTSQLNQWAAQHIRGVDLSFGVDQYEQSRDGENSTTTSYSYQLSKSLFNNKFKIVVGGNYSTDASADENFAQNLISDISFEYMLKQTQNLSMYVRLFRHTGWESILEGEITETGAGFVMKRRLSTLRQLWPFRKRRSIETVSKDTVDSIEKGLDR